jgi:hypothetical protein
MGGSRGVCADTSSLTFPGSSSYVEEESGSSGPGLLERWLSLSLDNSFTELCLAHSFLPGVPCNSWFSTGVTSPPHYPKNHCVTGLSCPQKHNWEVLCSHVEQMLPTGPEVTVALGFLTVIFSTAQDLRDAAVFTRHTWYTITDVTSPLSASYSKQKSWRPEGSSSELPLLLLSPDSSQSGLAGWVEASGRMNQSEREEGDTAATTTHRADSGRLTIILWQCVCVWVLVCCQSGVLPPFGSLLWGQHVLSQSRYTMYISPANRTAN